MKRIVGILIVVVLFSSVCSARAFKDCSELKEQCFNLTDSPKSPFIMKSETNTKAAVLVHGLTDSPYFTKDLALLLYSQGYNVYSVLLTGHESKAEDLFKASREQWLKDVKHTILYAKNNSQVRQTTLVGFSLGGVLATRIAQDPAWKNDIANLILIAPAFQIKENLGRAMCATGAYRMKPWARDNPALSPVRFNKMPFHAVCELVDLSAVAREEADLVKAPVFMAVTDADATISTEAATETFFKMSSRKKKLFYITKLNTSHSDMVFKYDTVTNKKNPLFNQMSQKIIQFLK